MSTKIFVEKKVIIVENPVQAETEVALYQASIQCRGCSSEQRKKCHATDVLVGDPAECVVARQS